MSDCPCLCVWSEVLHSFQFSVACHKNAWHFVRHRHRKVWIGLVILESNVERWIELLDPRKFQLQCLKLGFYNRPVDIDCALYHSARSLMKRFKRGEIALQPGSKVLRFTNVENSSLTVIKAVNTRSGWDFRGFWPKREIVRHLAKDFLQEHTSKASLVLGDLFGCALCNQFTTSETSFWPKV